MMIFVFPSGGVLPAFLDLGASEPAVHLGTCFQSQHLGTAR